MNKPEWTVEGLPANDEALLADALEWLLWIKRNVVGNSALNVAALEGCISDIRKRLPAYTEVGL